MRLVLEHVVSSVKRRSGWAQHSERCRVLSAASAAWPGEGLAVAKGVGSEFTTRPPQLVCVALGRGPSVALLQFAHPGNGAHMKHLCSRHLGGDEGN